MATTSAGLDSVALAISDTECSRREAAQAIEWAVECGYRHVDTATAMATSPAWVAGFNFELSEGEMAAIDACDRGLRLGADPHYFNV